MIPIPPEEISRITPVVEQIKTYLFNNPTAKERISWLGDYLSGAESRLIASTISDLAASGITEEYSPEFGHALALIQSYFPSLTDALGLPQTKFTPALFETLRLSLSPHVGDDGTIYGFGTYEQLDYRWSLAAIYYVAYWIGLHPRPPFGHNPQQYKISAPSMSVKVALVGDWGTGVWQDGSAPACPSTQVMNAIAALAPDITIHLGDVYYGGTMPTSQFPSAPNEEENNFTALWNPGSSMNFTLNSNHEMYFAGQAYFATALGAQAFGIQNQTSYFAIEGDSWVIIGLDSSYWSDSQLVMEGALTDYKQSDTSQLEFLQQYQNCGKTVIVMTHHNPVSLTGTDTVTQSSAYPWIPSSELPVLLDQVYSSLGSAYPNFWYWGHIHNGIAYGALPTAPGMVGRCAGHGAIPFGCARALVQSGSCSNGPLIPTVQWFDRTPGNPDSESGSVRVVNGFTLLTFEAQSFTETFYDQNGNQQFSMTYQYAAVKLGATA